MVQHVALSVLGKDRPGIVAAVAKVLFETGCNIEDSSMTSLRNEFAMILLVALPGGLSPGALGAKLSRPAREMGLSVSVRPLRVDEGKKARPAGAPYVISVYGADKPGIVYRIARLLAEKKVNITDVQTKVSGRGKNAAYIMLLEVEVPRTLPFGSLRTELEKAGAALNITVSAHPVEETRL